MPHDSHHHAAASAKKPHSEIQQYWMLLGITAFIAIIQSIGGWTSGSIALWADTLHVLLDGVGEGIALYVAYTVHTKTDPHQFRVDGMRLSCSFLLAAVAWNAYEASTRFSSPPDVIGWQVMLTAGIGALLNASKHLLISHDHSPNAHGERLHIVQDVMIGVAVVVSGLAIWLTQWRYIDPVLSLVISVYVGYSTIKLMFHPPDKASPCGHSH